MDTRPTAAAGAGGDGRTMDAPAALSASTGRLNDYLSRLEHRVSLMVVDGSGTTNTTLEQPRTPTHGRGQGSLAQRIQQLIAEEEAAAEGGSGAEGGEQELGDGDGFEQQRQQQDGSMDFSGEAAEAGAADEGAPTGGGMGLRRQSFLPRDRSRHSLTSLLFRSIDSSSGAGAGAEEEGEKEGDGGRGGATTAVPGAAAGTAAAAVASTTAVLATTSPSPVLLNDDGAAAALTGDWGSKEADGNSSRRARLSLSPRAVTIAMAATTLQGGEEEEEGKDGGCSEQQQQGRKDPPRRATMMPTAGGSGGAAGVVLKGELASVKSALRHDLEELHTMVLDVAKRVKEIETDIKQRGKLQAAKDTAQDELMEMELKQLGRQIEAKLSRTEIIDITQLQHQKMKALETSVLGVMDERAQRLQHKLHDELEKVLQQLYNIQQASDKTRRVVEERVKQSTNEQLAVQRELQKERRDKEELQGLVKRLADRVGQAEVKQTEEALKQREAVRGAEERWQQQLARESADARKEIQALGMAVGEEVELNVATIRTERLELKAELLAALRDLDARLAACREELSRQAAETAAVQERKLETLNASLQSTVESRVEGVKAELLARIEALSSLQQAHDAKTAVALQRQAERVGVLHEEALASVDASKREAAERLREKISGVEAAMQESHMQLSQRLSSAVQRLALSEVRGVERYDLLKALLKEVATKLLKAETAAGLAKDAPLQEVIHQLEVQRTANAADAARVDHLLVGLAESCKQMRGTVQALASRDNHGTVLETRLAEHCRGLVDQCVSVQIEPPTPSSSSSSSSNPISIRMPSAQRVILRRETRDFIATNSYRIAKTIAAKADYEVIRLLVGRREAMGDEECDATILRLRETYLHQFMQALATGVEKKHPTTTTTPPNPNTPTPTPPLPPPSRHAASLAVAEARQHFYEKVEQAVRLALSKFSRVHAGRSLFGKIGLGVGAEPPPPTCACCNHPFPSHDGAAARHACVLPPTAARQQAQQQAQQAAGAGTARGTNTNSSSKNAMRPTVSSALRPAVSLELDASSPSSSHRGSSSGTRARASSKAAATISTRPTGPSRQDTYSAVDEILKDVVNQGRSGGRFFLGGGGGGRK